MSIKGSLVEACTRTDPQLPGIFQAKQKAATRELYTLQEVESC